MMPLSISLRLAGLLSALAVVGQQALAQTPPPGKIDYGKDVAPLLAKYCSRCHSGAKPKGGVALDAFKDEAAVKKNLPLWEKVADNLRSGDMPPPGKPRPSDEEFDRLGAWLDREVFKIDCTGKRDPGRVTIRRLNRAEYNNTIRDLLGVKFTPADDFPADDVGYGFDNIGDVLSMPPLLMEKYLAAAEKVVEEAFKDAELHSRIILLPLLGKGRYETARLVVKTFAGRAYRRPATDEEVRRLVKLVETAEKEGDTQEAGIKLACQAVLVSPHFLFRVESDREPNNPDLIHPINEWELATRLSYFLWSSMPDEELYKQARDGLLRRPGHLEVQVKRMLKDHRSRALVENFAGQWLQTRNLKGFMPDPKQFPSFNEELRSAMLRETELFFEHIVREDRSLLEFLDADYTFVNERLAKHYGLAGVKGDEFRKVSLKGERGGILTQASVLTITSNPTRTSPVKRGKWILENILGTPPPPPPPGVEELKEDQKAVLSGSLRQRMEQHRANPSCAACHARMDPLGFGFENFNAIGAWRTQDGKHPIDPSGVLPGGQTFKGPVELRAILKTKQQAFVRCLTEKLLTYALGRGTERTDRCYIEEIARGVAKNGHTFSSLILEIVKSEPFQMRRGKRGATK